MTHEELFVLAVLCINIFLSIYLEQKTPLRHLGAALLCIIITAITANIGLIPSASSPSIAYKGIFSYVAPASIFMLLLGVSLRQLKVVGRPMLILFVIGATGTFLGVLLANNIIGSEFGDKLPPIAGMITGTYIGGSINFNAIALHYNMVEEGALFTSIVAVDNILTTIWMAVTLLLPVAFRSVKNGNHSVEVSPNITKDDTYDTSKLSIDSLAVLILSTVSAMWLSNWLADQTGIPSILILTTIALVLAQFSFFNTLPESKVLGLFLVYLFMTVVGAFCELAALSDAGALALTALFYLSIVVGVHGLVILTLGWILKLDWHMISIASQANIGGSSSALALAKSFKRDDLLLAAVLTGALGNAIGTYLGFYMASL